jgi:hypothetical protein
MSQNRAQELNFRAFSANTRKAYGSIFGSAVPLTARPATTALARRAGIAFASRSLFATMLPHRGNIASQELLRL